MDKYCDLILEDGSQCTAYRQKGSQYCFKHNQTPEERSLVSQHGGLSGKVIVGFGGKRLEIKKPRHIRKALVSTLNLLKDGQIEPNIANSIGYLCGVIIKTFELIEFEERIREIEKKLSIEDEGMI